MEQQNELNQYVQSELQKGVMFESVINTLLSNGWTGVQLVERLGVSYPYIEDTLRKISPASSLPQVPPQQMTPSQEEYTAPVINSTEPQQQVNRPLTSESVVTPDIQPSIEGQPVIGLDQPILGESSFGTTNQPNIQATQSQQVTSADLSQPVLNNQPIISADIRESTSEEPFIQPSTESPEFSNPVLQAKVDEEIEASKTTKKRNILLPVLLSLISLGAISFGAYYLFTNVLNKETVTIEDSVKSFDYSAFTEAGDDNHSIRIPKDWTDDPKNEDGNQVFFYYSPEDSVLDGYKQAAYLTVYSPGYDNRRGDLITEIEKTSTYIIVNEDSFESDGVQYDYMEIIHSNEDDVEIRTATVDAMMGEKIISADIVTSNEYWDQHSLNTESILKSLKPL